MSKITLKLFATGLALTLTGLLFLISPREKISCLLLGQILIGMLTVLIALSSVNLYLNLKKLKRKKSPSSKRKILPIFLLTALILLVATGLNNERKKQHQESIATFSQMVVSTDKALLDFAEIDERYLAGKETRENYEEAWYDLNFKLEQIKKQNDKLRSPPKELEELVSLYRSGFYRVLSVTNDVVDYLSGKAKDPMIIVKDRKQFEEGLKLLKEVKDRLQSTEEVR